MKECDLLISATWALPVAPENTVLDDHCLAVTDGEIVGLAPRKTMLAEYRPAELIELDNHILLPGLVNAHGHGAMSLLRGAGDDVCRPLR